LGLLEQDKRLPSLFAATSKRLGLRPGRRQLGQQVKRHERGLWAAMSQIAGSLGLPWWVAYDLLALYLQRHLKLLVVRNSERPPFEEPAPKQVRLAFTPVPGSTMADARREAERRIAELLPALSDDTSRAPRDGASHLAEAVHWFYLRRCIAEPVSERGLASYLSRQARQAAVKVGKKPPKPISRTRVSKAVREVERLFSLIQ
jgi:hypothetical protein